MVVPISAPFRGTCSKSLMSAFVFLLMNFTLTSTMQWITVDICFTSIYKLQHSCYIHILGLEMNHEGKILGS